MVCIRPKGEEKVFKVCENEGVKEDLYRRGGEGCLAI